MTLVLSLVMVTSVFLTGCDSEVASNEGSFVTFEGRVTEEPGFGKRGDIEGAVVTASNVQADGSLDMLEGETTTDAEGRYALQVAGAAETVVLTARKDDFRSKLLVVHEQETGGTIRTMPMTVESDAEASVYIESAAEAGQRDGGMAVADVAVYVNGFLASEWKAGRTTAAEIAAALRASVEAEASFYAEDDQSNVDSDQVDREQRRHFLTLQSALNAAVTAEAESAALSAFEQGYVAAYGDAGASIEAQAKARQAGRASLLKFYNASSAEARFALRQQVEILTSTATARAIEAAFETEGASDASLEALAEARVRLMTSLRAALSERSIEDALREYESAVESQIVTELNIAVSILGLVDAALSSAKATLEASIASAASAEAVASAYLTYFASAEASASAALETVGNTELGVQVVTLLSVQ